MLHDGNTIDLLLLVIPPGRGRDINFDVIFDALRSFQTFVNVIPTLTSSAGVWSSVESVSTNVCSTVNTTKSNSSIKFVNFCPKKYYQNHRFIS
jgi:hypothetical protein